MAAKIKSLWAWVRARAKKAIAMTDEEREFFNEW